MNKIVITTLMIGLLWGGLAIAAESAKEKTPKMPETVNVTYVSSKKVLLVPGSVQNIKVGKENLIIAYEQLHKTGNFPIVRIQDIPYKLTSKGQRIEFTWQQAGYELLWQGRNNEVTLMSSEDFAKESFSVANKNINNKMIFKGLTVKTKRRNGMISKLEIVNVSKDSQGKMEKFSVRTFADENNPSDYHNENNILAPEYHKQYEKGVNDEVLYIFTSNENGEIFVYYR